MRGQIGVHFEPLSEQAAALRHPSHSFICSDPFIETEDRRHPCGCALFLKSTQIQEDFELSNDLHVLARAKRAEGACGWALALLVASYLPLPTSHLRQQPSKFCLRDRRERSPGPAGQSCCGSSTAAPPRSGSSSPRPCSSCPRSTPAATSLETTASQLHSCSTPEVKEVVYT